ncbi:MAG TPA: hypothetical protein VNG33_19570, partial [Polyangiaceae bacterium]|nr:hypothetical protein [Polyangiaceae bacterium]
VEDDPLAQALSDDTPPPRAVAAVAESAGDPQAGPAPSAPVPSAVTNALMPWAGPAKKQAAELAAEPAAPAPKPAPGTFGQTLPLSALKAPAGIATAKSMAELKETKQERDEPRRSDVSTQPPQAATRPVSSKTPLKADAKPQAAPAEGNGGWLRTAVFAVIAAGASYYGVTLVSSLMSGPKPPALAVSAASAVTPVPSSVVSAALAPADSKLQFMSMETPLPDGTDVPAGNGLLEIKVPDGTAIRVDGEYLGMGPGRRVPLPAGSHELTLGDNPPLTVKVTAGQRTLAHLVVTVTTPIGSP